MGVVSCLGLFVNGPNHKLVSDTIDGLCIDTSHFFNGQMIGELGSCPKTAKRRLIIERGRSCEKCGLKKWMDKDIPLEIHHIDETKRELTRDNILLLCPNCHSLTENFTGKSKRSK